MSRGEAGFTLTEVLVVSLLMIMVVGGALTALNAFQANASRNEHQNDAQDEARRAVDQLARELRNLASPVVDDPKAVKKAAPQDLIVQSVGAVRPAGSLNSRNTQFVRYCYEAAAKRVHRQVLTWTTQEAPAVPASGSCPAAGWESTSGVASNVVNGTRPLFTYNGVALDMITEIHSSLWIDADPTRSPKETSIQTTVFLRNQNRVPIARFSAEATANGAILLNGAASEDPEERALSFFWHDGNTNAKIGEGIVHTYTPPGPGIYRIYLRVEDPARLESVAPTQTVCVPGAGVTC